DFRNTIVLMTSNVGAESIRARAGLPGSKGPLDPEVMAELRRHFRPEFLNRFDAILPYQPLAPNELRDIVHKFLGGAKDKLATGARPIALDVTPRAITRLAAYAADGEMGARPIKRAIQDNVEDLLAMDELHDRLNREGTVTVDFDGKKFTTKFRPGKATVAVR